MYSVWRTVALQVFNSTLAICNGLPGQQNRLRKKRSRAHDPGKDAEAHDEESQPDEGNRASREGGSFGVPKARHPTP